MKIYFDGSSMTYGDELRKKESRYSALIADKLGAEDHNFARSAGSNRRIVRNLIEKDLSLYDMFVIQLTAKKARTEFYNGTDWIRVKYPVKNNSNKFWGGMNEFWEEYYRNIYHDEFGRIDREICYHAIMNLLHGKKYLILDEDQCMKLAGSNRASDGHPNEKGHELIAKYVLDNI